MELAQRHRNLLSIFAKAAAIGLISLASFGCVSVNLGAKAGERSKGVEYDAPGSPFRELEDTNADGAWQNSSNGSSISYFSTCNDPADPTLDTVSRELFAGLADLKTLRSQNTTYNGREALEMEVEGKVEGVTTRIRSMMFKKNGCLYTLSHIGVPKAFEEDRPRFNEFLRSFQAP